MTSSATDPRTLDRRALLSGATGGVALAACRSASPAHDATGAPATTPMKDNDELDELFADLTDASGELAPISREEKRARLARVAAALREAGVDALLMEAGATLRYVSDVSWGHSERLFGLVVSADGEAFWICPGFEVPRARERIEEHGPDGPIVAWQEHEYAWRPLASALAERRIERIAVDPRARAFVAQSLTEELGHARVLSGAPVVRAFRGIKDAREQALLRRANELTKRAIGAVAERLEPGISDHELGRWIRRAQERLGLRGVWVLPLLDEGAAYPHGGPEGRVLARGDSILVDTGGALHDYQSDITRSWVFDAAPSAEFERGWNTVRDAQRRGFEALRPGVACREVDRAARAVIEAAGYGDGYAAFAHRLGHGIGLEGHEEPHLDGGNEVHLAPGMTFSNEPGIYLPGRLGLRIEDIVVVTATGADVFGEWQAGPRSPMGDGAPSAGA